MKTEWQSLMPWLLIISTAILLVACAEAPTAFDTDGAGVAQHVAQAKVVADAALATLRRATARYHDLDTAIADGFVLLHPCEERPGEGPVGIVYVHLDRLLDGVIDAESPDALVYEPSHHGRPKLVGVELAVPFELWTAPEPPRFLGAVFQPEDEFGVWALHAWVWRRIRHTHAIESSRRESPHRA